MTEPWDEFVRWAKRFYEAPDFDRGERDYKLRLARKIAEARAALEADGDWFDLLKSALKSTDNNITRFNQRDALLDWLEINPADGTRALRAIWDEQRPLEERIDRFAELFPRESLSGRGLRTTLASLLLLGVSPTETPPYKPEHFNDAYRLTGFPPAKEKREAAEYVHALGFLDRVLEETRTRGVELRDRLDGQAVVWAVLKNGLPEPYSDEEAQELERYRGVVPRVWWVNQGQSYETERKERYLFAPLIDHAGRTLTTHANVSRLNRGDVILHYARGAIRALGEVSKRAGYGHRPGDASIEEGRIASVDYHELERPIELDEIPLEWRKGGGGPFDVTGGVKQGYLYLLAETLALEMQELFLERWPSGAPWGRRAGYWLFQANPKQWDLVSELASRKLGDVTEWSVTRYRDEYQIGDQVILWQAGKDAGIYALGELVGEPVERSEAVEWMTGEGPHVVVPVGLTRILDQPIRKKKITDHPVLGGLSVLSSPQGTNFRVEAAQWRALRQLIDAPRESQVARSLEEIRDAIAEAGMLLDSRTLRRFHHSLRTKGFVVLSGVSGTGKTWLAALYGEAVGAEVLLVPVAPNWTTNEDLLGWQNPLSGSYQHTDFSRFLLRAQQEFENAQEEGREPIPFLLLLDEMNLARVEYYFAKFLSAMEIRSRQGVASLTLAEDLSARLYPNLWFVGTVNIDETTHGFADKVFDRAQLIELTVDRPGIEARLGDAPYAAALLEVWDAVAEIKPFAFRIVDETRDYVSAVEDDGGTWDDALDEIILQKVLPKLNGSDPRIGGALESLVDLSRDRYPLSHEKASRMLDQYEMHGFTSYF